MNRSEIINKVKTRIDEVSSSDSLIIDVGIEDNKPIDEIIDEVLDGSILEILSSAPLHYLPVKKADITTSVEFELALQATSASATIQITGLNVDMEAMMVAKGYCSFGDITCNAGDRIDLVIDGQQQASKSFTYATKTNLVIETLLNEIEGIKLIVEDNKYVLYFADDLSAKTCRIVNITRNIIFECSEGLIQTLTPHPITIPQKGIGETIIFGVGSSTTTYTLTIQQGDTPESISSSIASMLNGKDGINAISYGNTVVVTAIVPGKQGNNISLGFNTPNNMQINNNDMFVFLSGGEDAVISVAGVKVAGYSIIKNIATFELPSDFLRLARLKLDCWKDYVCNFTDENSAIARRQRDIFLRATTEYPVAVRRNNTIMAYSVPSSSANAVIEYVGNALFEGSQCVITDNKAIEALLWRCAAKALIIIGRTNEVQICETKSAEALV